MIKLIAADMDGTLLDSQLRLPEGFFDLVEELYRRNIRFAVSSGRQYYNLREIFEPVKDKVLFIAENGGVVFDGDTPLFSELISKDDVRDILALVRQHPGKFPLLCGVKSGYVQDDDPEFISACNKCYARLDLVPEQLDVIEHDDFCKVAVFDTNAEFDTCPLLVEHLSDRFRVVLSGETWVDTMSLNNNKGVAIRKVQKLLNISHEETMAFGDYLNDLEMMVECYHSYAMANAHPELKKVSRFTAPSNDDGGVATVIRELLEQPGY